MIDKIISGKCELCVGGPNKKHYKIYLRRKLLELQTH